jgi:succinate dehydrogenase flavin-adding protein (antitoxin of CptAB toxin-antitoxin module)
MPIDFDKLKVRQPLDLGGYDEQLAGQSIEVWVNLSRRVLLQFGDNDAMTTEQVKALYSEIWDLDANDYDLLINEADPALWNWIVSQTWELVSAYRESRKKAVKD